jgi:transcriptional regulator with XRE-family HTH domain
MTMGGDLIRESRLRAGLTQRELAAGAGTTQSAIARWESGRADPKFETVRRVMRAAGFALLVALDPYDDSDLAQAMERLKLPPEERLAAMERLWSVIDELRSNIGLKESA